MPASKLLAFTAALFFSMPMIVHADTQSDKMAAEKVCARDREKLCPGKTPATGLFLCFHRNHDKISKDCKVAMKKLRADKRMAKFAAPGGGKPPSGQ